MSFGSGGDAFPILRGLPDEQEDSEEVGMSSRHEISHPWRFRPVPERVLRPSSFSFLLSYGGIAFASSKLFPSNLLPQSFCEVSFEAGDFLSGFVGHVHESRPRIIQLYIREMAVR
jgi:hypothetical protein